MPPAAKRRRRPDEEFEPFFGQPPRLVALRAADHPELPLRGKQVVLDTPEGHSHGHMACTDVYWDPEEGRPYVSVCRIGAWYLWAEPDGPEADRQRWPAEWVWFYTAETEGK